VFALSFAYGWGYAQYFGVPAALVEVSSKNLLICAASLITLGGSILFIWFHLGMPIWKKCPLVIRKALAAVAMWPIGAAAMYFIFGFHWFYLLLYGACMVIIAVSEFALPLLSPAGTYVQKLDRIWGLRIKIEAGMPSLLRNLNRRYGDRTIVFAAAACTALIAAFGEGYREARTKTDFLVPESGSPCVIVAPFSDDLICVEFAGPNNQLTHAIRLIPLHESPPGFRLRHLGWLPQAEDQTAASVIQAKALSERVRVSTPPAAHQDSQ
jgi:hypothetical protein